MKSFLGSIAFEVLVGLGLVHWRYVADTKATPNSQRTTGAVTKVDGAAPSVGQASLDKDVRLSLDRMSKRDGLPQTFNAITDCEQL
ncbi:MAG: hypothetical protein OJF52_000493 [Nitrospira sp.]|jgi:2-hydroxychromene-2-carboxylate isomerase|nr:MAG: hypothetical protein OJF52_000493 [Nitrospira sp.]